MRNALHANKMPTYLPPPVPKTIHSSTKKPSYNSPFYYNSCRLEDYNKALLSKENNNKIFSNCCSSWKQALSSIRKQRCSYLISSKNNYLSCFG